MKLRTTILCTAASLVSITQAGPGLAQVVAATPPEEQIQEIVVTAQKRSENINSVGVSITAATGDQLKQKNVTTVSDLTRIEPSLQFSQSSYGTPIYTIRGVGYFEQSLAASPTVSIYQDEVPFPFSVMSKGVLLDPERVEILKGPQGTLYGQNATGGAINFISAKPTSTFTAGFDASFSRFNDTVLSGFVSGPLTSTLSARLAGSIEQGGAWQRSQTRNDTLGDKDVELGRLILDWKPSSQFTASLNLNGWRDHSANQAPQLEGIRFISPAQISPNALSPVTANYLPNAAYYATYPAAIQGIVNQPTNPASDREADWAPGTHPQNREEFYQASLRMDYSISDKVGITSLTSYQHFKENNLVEPGGVGLVYTFDNVQGSVESVSQELRLHGLLFGEKLHWLVGANYAHDDSREADVTDPFLGSPAYLTGGSLFSSIPLQSFTFTPISNVRTTTKSAFGNVDYDVARTVTLHAGVRYTESDQSIDACAQGSAPLATYISIVTAQLAGAFGAPPPTPVTAGQCITVGPPPTFQPGLQHVTLNEHNVPWRVGVDWKPAEGQLIYATVSKGFKAGASPSLGATNYTQVIPVTQESILAFEVGAKSTLFDRRLQLNASYFHYNYRNKQTLGTRPVPIFGALQALVNIPRSAEDGVEVTAVVRPTRSLTLNGAVTYLNSRVTRDFFNYSSYIIDPNNTVNFKGEPFPFTPKWSLQAGVRYDWSLTSNLGAFVSADGSYQSSSTAAFGSDQAIVQGAPPQSIKAYGLLNLTAGISTSDKRWRLEVFGRNVTNTYYWNTVVTGGDTQNRLTGLPATYGVNVHFRY